MQYKPKCFFPVKNKTSEKEKTEKGTQTNKKSKEHRKVIKESRKTSSTSRVKSSRLESREAVWRVNTGHDVEVHDDDISLFLCLFRRWALCSEMKVMVLFGWGLLVCGGEKRGKKSIVSFGSKESQLIKEKTLLFHQSNHHLLFVALWSFADSSCLVSYTQ